MSEHHHNHDNKEVGKRKFGKFKLSFNLINNNLLLVKHIMSKMDFIAGATQYGEPGESGEYIKYMEYVCQSEIFDYVGPEEDIPEYVILVNQSNLVVTAEIINKENK